MTYIYHFLRRPDLTRPMPDGLQTMKVHASPVYEQRLQCDTYGYVRYKRPLSTVERAGHGLVDDPGNHLPFVRKG